MVESCFSTNPQRKLNQNCIDFEKDMDWGYELMVTIVWVKEKNVVLCIFRMFFVVEIYSIMNIGIER